MKIVDGLELDDELRALLRPDELVKARDGCMHRLPRFFYEVESWEQAKETQLAPHFTLAELMTVDCREARRLLGQWPHYVPCAVSVLARYLEVFREKAGSFVFVSANGGYRSPSHARSETPDSHCWGAAADLYRVGDSWLNDPGSIAKFGQIAKDTCAEIFIKPDGATDDHLHFDLGYLRWVPQGVDEA